MIEKRDFVDLATKLDEPIGSYDYVAVADGSGTTLGQPCGSFLTFLKKDSQEPVWLMTTASSGTNNYAELYPFLNFLWWLESCKVERAKLLFVSDSEVTVRCAMGLYSRKANLGLWAMYDFYAKRFEIVWKHVLRNSNPINEECDERAKCARKLHETG